MRSYELSLNERTNLRDFHFVPAPPVCASPQFAVVLRTNFVKQTSHEYRYCLYPSNFAADLLLSLKKYAVYHLPHEPGDM